MAKNLQFLNYKLYNCIVLFVIRQYTKKLKKTKKKNLETI